MGAFFHAVHVFGDHLAAVRWQFLAIALGIHLARLALRGWAWRTILSAAYPTQRIKYLSAFGAYVAGVGINSIAPARAGDVVKLYLIRHRIDGSSYATLTPTLVAETLFDAVVATGFIVWALVIGALPTHQVYSRLPSVDWGFFVKHARWTEVGLALLVAALLIGIIIFVESGGPTRARIMQGFAIVHDRPRLYRGVLLPQALSWVLRIASLYYFLEAFHVQATIHNALLALVVDSLATLFPATPGGAGTKQGLIVFLFQGEAISASLLLAFSVGMNIAVVVFNLAAGCVAMFMMARTVSLRRIRASAAEMQEQA
ncbi:MAG TPA: lysylphosphatidylglycerol synthase transmembrane domain-containing protein [Gaiellaceae bacterium]|nr:lysylphosphatidylglycerol synthase transmembrane domain-containing protein [Gaiellaceae bacterium]